MNDATWRTHPLYTGYEISDDSRIRSTDRLVANRWGTYDNRKGRELKTSRRRSGYIGGNISVDGVRINFELHVMVCEAFHGIRPLPEHEVRHLNGDQLDNRPENLAWGTRTENAQDVLRHGRNHEANKTQCRRGHKFTAANIYRAPSRPNKRVCRKCMRINELNRSPRSHTRSAAA